jgi:hypothetical protein
MVTENKDAIGQKWDTGKAPVFQGFIKYFPRAIAAVAMVSQAGSNKYAAGKFPTKWREVPDGQFRYSDAMARHMLEEAKNNIVDDGPGGTNCLHLAQEAWNNLARLELFLQEQEANTTAITVGPDKPQTVEVVGCAVAPTSENPCGFGHLAGGGRDRLSPERRLSQPRRRRSKAITINQRSHSHGRRKDDAKG